LLLSQGTPMICGGDEIGRTQGGNNNAYCQDNETSWHDWELDDERKALLAFTQRCIRIRTEHPALRRAKFFKGRNIRGADIKDIMWFRHDGQPMSEQDWGTAYTRAIQLMVAGLGLDTTDEAGAPIVDDDLLLLINGGHESLDFQMPGLEGDAADWELLLDTSDDGATESVPTQGKTHLEGRALRLFRRDARGDRLSSPPRT
jgi:isoamylase